MSLYTIPKGSHFSEPRRPKFWIKRITGNFTFVNAGYEFKTDDQYDWNKLTGIAFNPLFPNQNAIMIGWRWNSRTDKVEVGAYFNIDFAHFSPDDNYLEVNEMHQCQFYVDYDRVFLKNLITGKIIETPVPTRMKKTFLTSFRIQPYFGGNQVAPDTIFINLDYV